MMADFEDWDDVILEVVFADEEGKNAYIFHDELFINSFAKVDELDKSKQAGPRPPSRHRCSAVVYYLISSNEDLISILLLSFTDTPRPKSKYTMENAISDQKAMCKQAVGKISADKFVSEATFKNAPTGQVLCRLLPTSNWPGVHSDHDDPVDPGDSDTVTSNSSCR